MAGAMQNSTSQESTLTRQLLVVGDQIERLLAADSRDRLCAELGLGRGVSLTMEVLAAKQKAIGRSLVDLYQRITERVETQRPQLLARLDELNKVWNERREDQFKFVDAHPTGNPINFDINKIDFTRPSSDKDADSSAIDKWAEFNDLLRDIKALRDLKRKAAGNPGNQLSAEELETQAKILTFLEERFLEYKENRGVGNVISTLGFKSPSGGPELNVVELIQSGIIGELEADLCGTGTGAQNGYIKQMKFEGSDEGAIEKLRLRDVKDYTEADRVLSKKLQHFDELDTFYRDLFDSVRFARLAIKITEGSEPPVTEIDYEKRFLERTDYDKAIRAQYGSTVGVVADWWRNQNKILIKGGILSGISASLPVVLGSLWRTSERWTHFAETNMRTAWEAAPLFYGVSLGVIFASSGINNLLSLANTSMAVKLADRFQAARDCANDALGVQHHSKAIISEVGRDYDRLFKKHQPGAFRIRGAPSAAIKRAEEFIERNYSEDQDRRLATILSDAFKAADAAFSEIEAEKPMGTSGAARIGKLGNKSREELITTAGQLVDVLLVALDGDRNSWLKAGYQSLSGEPDDKESVKSSTELIKQIFEDRPDGFSLSELRKLRSAKTGSTAYDSAYEKTLEQLAKARFASLQVKNRDLNLIYDDIPTLISTNMKVNTASAANDIRLQLIALLNIFRFTCRIRHQEKVSNPESVANSHRQLIGEQEQLVIGRHENSITNLIFNLDYARTRWTQLSMQYAGWSGVVGSFIYQLGHGAGSW